MNLKNYIQLSGPLFEAVQKNAIFSDGKTFVDSIPRFDPQTILNHFLQDHKKPHFDLKSFVLKNFILPKKVDATLITASNMREYIDKMWGVLLKKMDPPSPFSTLIALPNPHIVPGGRFQECFYWDSYFIAIGLLVSNKMELVKGMVENFAHLIDIFGFIPNGNRIYFSSRSQPPYFSFLLALLYENGEKSFALQYYPHLLREYQYWMNTAQLIDNKTSLNTYFDSLNIPRPEAYIRELSLAKEGINSRFFCELRAACASGWDFSSRWLKDGKNFKTIQTLEILPVDLNCLLYYFEMILDKFTRSLNKKDSTFQHAAIKRKNAIQTLFWNHDFFCDYHLPSRKHTNTYSLAGVTPLFVKACTQEQADKIAEKIEKHFLLDGGFVTSLTEGDHQWDMPNGWAPLQWITIQGLINYGYNDLAEKGARRWLDLTEKIYNETGTLLEKYNVRDCSSQVAKGEYALQQGFGWTNGVTLALMEKYPPH